MPRAAVMTILVGVSLRLAGVEMARGTMACCCLSVKGLVLLLRRCGGLFGGVHGCYLGPGRGEGRGVL